MSRFRFCIMGAAASLILTACSASAELRDGAPPTPQPAPAPQIVVIERPAPAAPEIPAGLIVLAVVGFGLPMAFLCFAAGWAINARRAPTVQYVEPPPMQVVEPPRTFGRGRVHLLTDEEYRALVHQAQRAGYLEAPHER